jgi:hypothetical protein
MGAPVARAAKQVGAMQDTFGRWIHPLDSISEISFIDTLTSLIRMHR